MLALTVLGSLTVVKLSFNLDAPPGISPFLSPNEVELKTLERKHKRGTTSQGGMVVGISLSLNERLSVYHTYRCCYSKEKETRRSRARRSVVVRVLW